MTQRTTFLVGCLLAALAVTTGAFGAHALAGHVTSDRLESWRTATLYHLVHAVALVAVASGSRWNNVAARGSLLLLLGVVAFSGSIYALVLDGPRWLGPITPLGGLAFIAGWILLGVSRYRSTN